MAGRAFHCPKCLEPVGARVKICSRCGTEQARELDTSSDIAREVAPPRPVLSREITRGDTPERPLKPPRAAKPPKAPRPPRPPKAPRAPKPPRVARQRPSAGQDEFARLLGILFVALVVIVIVMVAAN